MALISLLLASWALRAAGPNPADQHAALVGESVLQLLEVRDVESFADTLAVTNQSNKRSVLNSARLVVEQAKRMGLEPSRVRFRIKDVPAKSKGTTQVDGDTLPTSYGIKIILLGEPVRDIEGDKPLRGEYELALGGAIEFPEGWRTYEGIRWSRLPDAVPDERTRQEVLLVSNIVARLGQPLRAADDLALAALGSTLVRFLQQSDEKNFTTQALRSFEESWEELQKKLDKLAVKERPTKEDYERAWKMMRGQVMDSARGVLAKAEVLGIDFSATEITLKDASAEHPSMRDGYGSVDGLMAGPIRFTFGVKSNQKLKARQSIAGEYTLTCGRGRRGPDRWTIEEKLRWEKFPDGLLGEKELADLAFENYVEEHGALPPGTAAPDIGFVRLDDEANVKLSDFRGKVVVLEWWATWCGPCQGPMAELQKLREHHSSWKDRVEIIALSIDDELGQAKAHLTNRGWTNTFNAWAGPGGWGSAPAKQFRLHGVPTCYVIDAQGKVVQGGIGSSFSLTDAIAALLR